MTGFIAVDLDGTLATYDSGDYDKYGPYHIGNPIPLMVDRIKSWLAANREVVIFTARAYDKSVIPYIEKWCEKHIGVILQVTNIKHYEMIEFWDDRGHTSNKKYRPNNNTKQK